MESRASVPSITPYSYRAPKSVPRQQNPRKMESKTALHLLPEIVATLFLRPVDW